MLHPSEIAIEYIWDRFTSTYIDEQSKLIINEIEKLKKAINHKPFNVKSNIYQKFIKNNLDYIELLQKKYPFLNFNKEKDFFMLQLSG